MLIIEHTKAYFFDDILNMQCFDLPNPFQLCHLNGELILCPFKMFYEENPPEDMQHYMKQLQLNFQDKYPDIPSLNSAFVLQSRHGRNFTVPSTT